MEIETVKKVIFEKTRSICPVCKEVIEADIVEEDGSIWMEKSCALHGFFKAKIAKYAWYYKGLNKFYELICPQRHPYTKENIRFYYFYPTINCNLNCPICFANAGINNNLNKDISLDEIKKMINAIKEPHRIIGIAGGEPTVRNDLCEIIRVIIKAGHTPLLFTNGINLGNFNYLRMLKRCGLRYVFLWLDTLSDDNIYEKIRGRKLLAIKRMILDNLKIINMPTGIVFVLMRGINEGEIEEIFDFARKNNFIRPIVIKSYSNLGRKGFSLQEELTMDETVEIISRETKGLITLEEFFLFQKITNIVEVLFLNQAVCYLKQKIIIPKDKDKRMREIFDLREMSRYLDTFEEIYRESPFRAKAYFLEKIFIRLIQNPKFLYSKGKQVIYPNSFDYTGLVVTSSYTPYTYDIEKISTRCNDAWLSSYNSEKITDLCWAVINGCVH